MDGEKREYILKDGTSIALYEQALTHGVGGKQFDLIGEHWLAGALISLPFHTQV